MSMMEVDLRHARRSTEYSGVTKDRYLRLGWTRFFLERLRATGNIAQSCKDTGISRGSITYLRARDKDFITAMDEAHDDAMDMLEEEARRRAVEGDRSYRFNIKGDPLIHPETGKPYYEVQRSDRLLITLLQAGRPDKFRDRPVVSINFLTRQIEREAVERGVDTAKLIDALYTVLLPENTT